VSLTFKSRWDEPLEYEYDFRFLDLKVTINSSIEQVFKRTTGELAASYRVRRSQGGHGVTITSALPYAAAQEYGANIPERRPVNAAALRFETAGGVVFSKYARAFHLEARPHVEPAVDEWARDVMGVAWKGELRGTG
jgi:hypothetical protein